MASPLTVKPSSAINTATPTTITRQNTHATVDYRHSTIEDNSENVQDSTFLTNIQGSQEPVYISPTKALRLSAIPLEQEAGSPAKTLINQITVTTQSPQRVGLGGGKPLKISPTEKIFPVKENIPPEDRLEEHIMPLNRVMQDNEGLTRAIEILEEEKNVLGYEEVSPGSDDTIVSIGGDLEPESFADETAFSTFSAVPDMTMFARIGHSPTKSAAIGQMKRENTTEIPLNDPKSRASYYPISPPPGHQASYDTIDDRDETNTTNLILDFTEQFNSLSGSSYGCQSASKRERFWPSKSQTMPELFAYTQCDRTPSPTKYRQQLKSPGRMSNLLDFDIPPPPTPRSMPTITPRELESLKSSFLSEISSLRASLSGKEAEILSLKTAIGNAEKRVGECMEQVCEERNRKEQLAAEKEGWEKRGREMELVLRNVKEEILHGEREREALESRLEESEKRKEEAEIMAQEAESRIAGMRAASVSANDSAEDMKSQPEPTSRELEVAVEKVARELHTLYRNKHETKVAALKKSYEGRWEKKVRDLEAKVNELGRENEELRVGRDTTMSGVVPRMGGLDITEEFRSRAAEDAKAVKELEARLQGLSEEVKSTRRDNAELRSELEKERIEKGELVAACDELLALQETTQATHPAVKSSADNLRSSISRGSGLRAPNVTGLSTVPPNESRIGKVERGKSSSVQGIRPGSGLGFRSGIMNSIEKMGSHKGRAE